MKPPFASEDDNSADADRQKQMHRRKEQNRNAQRRLRERKEEYTAQLELQLTELHRHSQTQEDESQYLREALDRSRKDNLMLANQINMLHQSVPSTQVSHPLPERASIDLGINPCAPQYHHHAQERKRSRSQSQATAPQLANAVNTLSQAHSSVQLPNKREAASESPVAPIDRSGASTRSPTTSGQEQTNFSPHSFGSQTRENSEQTDTSATSSNRSLEAVKLAGDHINEHTSSLSYQPQASDGLIAYCLESIYSQPASRPPDSVDSGASCNFTASWTPGLPNHSMSDHIDYTNKPPGITPGSFEMSHSTDAGQNSNWTMPSWFDMGASNEMDHSKAYDAGNEIHDVPAQRTASLASRRGFSSSLKFEPNDR